MELDRSQVDRSQVDQSLPMYQTKVQRRRSRSRDVGRRQSKIYQDNSRQSIA